jgi:hypothetical protein
MGNLNESIAKLLTGNNPRVSLMEATKVLVRKWEGSGLLDGVERDYDKHGMAVLLENQARQLIDEASRTGTTAGSEEWSGVALPLVRKIFGEIASKDFVSVQPMNLPSGLVFYLDFKYGTTKAGFTSGESIYGTTNTSADASGGLYGSGRFGYSINSQSLSGSKGATITRATWSDINFRPELSNSIYQTELFELAIATSSFTTPDVEGVKAFRLSRIESASSAVTIVAQFPAYATVSGPNFLFYFSASTSAGTGITTGATTLSNVTASIYYNYAPTAITRGDYEQSSFTVPGPATADDLQIPEINVSMNSVPIVAKTRKLKAIWTPEFAQDLQAYHSIDAEAELTSMLSEYISMEIDLEILDMLIVNAITTEFWSAEVGAEYNSSTGLFVSSAASNSNAYTKMTWFQTLGTKLQKVSNKIHQKTMRGGANFLVCSPEVATILESIPGFAADTDGDKMKFAMGVQKIGAINNRFNVYKNPYMLDNIILMGFRGTQFLETGAVYAPYVPLITTPLVYDPQNFTPRKGVMTRYAKKIVRPEFYGKVVIGGVDQI